MTVLRWLASVVFLMLNRDIKYVCVNIFHDVLFNQKCNNYLCKFLCSSHLSMRWCDRDWQADSNHFWNSFSLDSALWIKLFLL